ncbi:MAG TPA: sulfite exporter TauE/SafE family protein, partial [Ramlibacter sp.]|nr:sulfite exporter TauE/SafE family protein [Ramlibacter sp.]
PALWCTLTGVPKDAQRSIIQNFNLAVLLGAFAGYLATGVVTTSMVPALALAGAATLVPVLVGARLYRSLSEVAFRRVVLGLLTLSGAALLFAGGRALLLR